MKKLKVLSISGNHLNSLPPSVTGNLWNSLQNVYLDNNPWSCNATTLWLKHWMLGFGDGLKNQENIICQTPYFNRNQKMVSLSDDWYLYTHPPSDAEEAYWRALIGGSLAIGALILAIITFFSVRAFRFQFYVKYGWHPFDRDECDNEDKDFDVFISYSNHDDEWSRALIGYMEEKGFAVCFHERDFQAGMHINVNIEMAVAKSKRTMCVLTRNFIRSPICMAEFNIARSYDVQNNKHRLILIMYEDMPHDDLPDEILNYIKSYTYILWRSAFFYKRLMYQLPQRQIVQEPIGELTPLMNAAVN